MPGVVEGKPRTTAEAIAEIDQDAAAYSIDFIRRGAEDDQPFFLQHAFLKVHYDHIPAQGFAGTSAAKTTTAASSRSTHRRPARRGARRSGGYRPAC
jgi:hypothetical protein